MRSAFFILILLFLATGVLASIFEFAGFNLFLIIYLLAMLMFLLFTFFNIYHAWRFGGKSFVNFFTLFLYIVILATIVFISFNFISQTNWFEPVNFGLK